MTHLAENGDCVCVCKMDEDQQYLPSLPRILISFTLPEGRSLCLIGVYY